MTNVVKVHIVQQIWQGKGHCLKFKVVPPCHTGQIPMKKYFRLEVNVPLHDAINIVPPCALDHCTENESDVHLVASLFNIIFFLSQGEKELVYLTLLPTLSFSLSDLLHYIHLHNISHLFLYSVLCWLNGAGLFLNNSLNLKGPQWAEDSRVGLFVLLDVGKICSTKSSAENWKQNFSILIGIPLQRPKTRPVNYDSFY